MAIEGGLGSAVWELVQEHGMAIKGGLGNALVELVEEHGAGHQQDAALVPGAVGKEHRRCTTRQARGSAEPHAEPNAMPQ